MRALPHPREAQQLARLRSLRVQRARDRCTQAQAQVERAMGAVEARQQEIERRRGEVGSLAHAMVHGLAPAMPRWAELVDAQREKLSEALERAEYALIRDERELEDAQERLQQARAELTRALAREDAVRGLADEVRRAHGLMREQRAELELEDQGRGSPRSR
jgi:hypothetical protein